MGPRRLSLRLTFWVFWLKRVAVSAGLERLWAAPLHVGHCAPVRRLCWQPALPSEPQGNREASSIQAGRGGEAPTVGGAGANGSRGAAEANTVDNLEKAGLRLASCGDDHTVRLFHAATW